MGNPVLDRLDVFNGRAQRGGQPGYAPGPGQFPGQGYGQPQGYGQHPGQFPGQHPGQYQQYQGDQTGRMTFDDVITKTAICLALVAVVAALAWNFIPDALIAPALIVSALVGFVTVLVASMRKAFSPGVVLFYAVVEGVFVGMFSKIFEVQYPGIVTQAVLATFATAGVTLAAYKFFNIRVTDKFRKVVFLATAGFAAAMLLNFVMVLFGANTGLRSIGGEMSLLALGVAALGAVLAVLNLVSDFDAVERGVASGADAKASWAAALGITVTMVWLYTEILRIISYFRR